MKKIRLVSTLAICLSVIGCQDSAKTHSFDSVDRRAVFDANTKRNSFLLVVTISKNGKLWLNKIETGTISDPSTLSEKIEVIFEDREKAGVSEREIVIDPQESVKNADLEKLVENLAAAKAAPIRIIKND